ncbi:hypothetical protein GCM10018779_54670 [Streptomyces griseocarneus]|nr:hypothetical protein GCM10018779_54670 [Streptomyces griseocarneus]
MGSLQGGWVQAKAPGRRRWGSGGGPGLGVGGPAGRGQATAAQMAFASSMIVELEGLNEAGSEVWPVVARRP